MATRGDLYGGGRGRVPTSSVAMIAGIGNAVIDGFERPVDLAVDRGRIAGIVATGGAPHDGGPWLDAGGRAVIAGLVDAHVHLDKAYQLDALAGTRLPLGTLPDALAATTAVQRTLSEPQRVAAAEQLLGQMVRHGTTAARVHVEIDGSGADPVGWHLALARAWSDRITLQLVAFPQHGLFGNPDADRALRDALDRGCTVVGGCPYADEDPDRHVRRVFEIAAERRLPVDFHIDFTDDPNVHDVDLVIGEAGRRQWEHGAVVGHVTSLAAMAPEDATRRARALAASGIGLISLPATDVFLSGRHADCNRPRGMAPLAALVDVGVDVAVATNNVGNAFTPYGNGSLLQVAWLAGLIGQFGPGSGHGALLAAVTAAPARMLGLESYGLQVGAWADLVVVDADRPSWAVAGPAEVVGVVHRGVVTWPATG